MSKMQDYMDQVQVLFNQHGEPAPDHNLSWQERQHLANLMILVMEHADQIDDSYFAGMDQDKCDRVQSILYELGQNGSFTQVVHKCLSYLTNSTHQGVTGFTPDPIDEPYVDIEKGEPLCAEEYRKFAWFEWWQCHTLLPCVWKFFFMNLDRIGFGACENTGPTDDDQCVCLPQSIPIEVLLLLLTIVTIWAGGPVVTGAGLAFLRRMALRAAAAGT